MSVLSDLFQDIADAIREKTGDTDKMSPADFPQAITGIQVGGEGHPDLRYVTFMFYDGEVELGKKAVAVGDDCADPISRGVFSTPTKESDAQYNYSFVGWATTPNGAWDEDALKEVKQDRTLYAAYASAIRYYTITYYDSDGTTVLKTELLAYGSVPSYTPTRDDKLFDSWLPTPVPVTEETSYQAVWGTDVVGTYDCGADGNNVKVTIFMDGRMRISGAGAMRTDYTYSAQPPWVSHSKSVTSVTIDQGITTLSPYTFYNCTALTSINIPDSVTIIGASAFSYCTALTSVNIPDSVTTLVGGVTDGITFYGCKALTSLTFGSGITKIPYNCCGNCSALANVTIRGNVTAIDGAAFSYCTQLASITIPASVTHIGQIAFTGAGLTSATFEDTTGWYVTKTNGASSGTNLDATNLADTGTAAKYLKTTYDDRYWYKKEA